MAGSWSERGRDREKGTLCLGLGAMAGRLARERANECLGWPCGIESQGLPGQAMTGIDPDVVGRRSRRAASAVLVYCFTLAMGASTHGCGVERRDRGSRFEVGQECLHLPCLAWRVIPQAGSNGTRVSRSAPSKRDPTKQRLAISSRQEALDIGSGKSKSSMLRYRDAAPLLSRTSAPLVLRSCYALPGRPLPSHGGHIIHRTTMM